MRVEHLSGPDSMAVWRNSLGPANQFGNRPPLRQDWDGPACRIGNGDAFVIDAQVPINRGGEVANADATVHGMLAQAIGGANHLTFVDVTAAEEERIGVRPVVAAGLGHAGTASNSPFATVTAFPPRNARFFVTRTFTTPPLADA